MVSHAVFTDQFIFRRTLGPFSPENRTPPCLSERMRSIRYQKGKLNAIKRQKNIIFRSVDFADWFVEFKRYSKFGVGGGHPQTLREEGERSFGH